MLTLGHVRVAGLAGGRDNGVLGLAAGTTYLSIPERLFGYGSIVEWSGAVGDPTAAPIHRHPCDRHVRTFTQVSRSARTVRRHACALSRLGGWACLNGQIGLIF